MSAPHYAVLIEPCHNRATARAMARGWNTGGGSYAPVTIGTRHYVGIVTPDHAQAVAALTLARASGYPLAKIATVTR